MQTERARYWGWVLQPEEHPTRRGILANRARYRSCPECEGRLSIRMPDRVATALRRYVGHDPDCLALALALTLDDTGPGNGGGGGPIVDAPAFGQIAPIFGSTAPVFGTN